MWLLEDLKLCTRLAFTSTAPGRSQRGPQPAAAAAPRTQSSLRTGAQWSLCTRGCGCGVGERREGVHAGSGPVSLRGTAPWEQCPLPAGTRPMGCPTGRDDCTGALCYFGRGQPASTPNMMQRDQITSVLWSPQCTPTNDSRAESIKISRI